MSKRVLFRVSALITAELQKNNPRGYHWQTGIPNEAELGEEHAAAWVDLNPERAALLVATLGRLGALNIQMVRQGTAGVAGKPSEGAA